MQNDQWKCSWDQCPHEDKTISPLGGYVTTPIGKFHCDCYGDYQKKEAHLFEPEIYHNDV